MKCTECGREIGHHTPDRDSLGRPKQTFIRCPHTGLPVEIPSKKLGGRRSRANGTDGLTHNRKRVLK